MEWSWIIILIVVVIFIVIIALFFCGHGQSTFKITRAPKSSHHPLLTKGSTSCLLVNGTEYKFLHLKRGKKYTFNVDISLGDFFITADPEGGPSSLPEFPNTPSPFNHKIHHIIIPKDAPRLLYYQNTAGTFEGCVIHVY